MPYLPASRQTVTSHPPASPLSERALSLFLRTRALRCVAVALLSVGLGILMASLLLPLLTEDTVTAVLRHHLPSDTSHPAAVWLALWLSRLPLLLLLMPAGLTRFSGGLCTAVLSAGGVTDGFTMLCLWRTAQNGLLPPPPLPLASAGWLAAYVLWTVPELLALLLMAVEARRLATDTVWSEGVSLSLSPALRSRLRRYALVCLASLWLSGLGAGIYTALLTHFIG